MVVEIAQADLGAICNVANARLGDTVFDEARHRAAHDQLSFGAFGLLSLGGLFLIHHFS
jgi:hypothetical protein